MSKIAQSYFYFIAKQKSPVRKSVDRGYKIFSESYIHEIEGKCSSLPVNNFKTRDIDRNSKLALMLNVGMFSAAVVLENDFWGLSFCIIMVIKLSERNLVGTRIARHKLQSTVRKKMATGTFTYNALCTKTLKERIKTQRKIVSYSNLVRAMLLV